MHVRQRKTLMRPIDKVRKQLSKIDKHCEKPEVDIETINLELSNPFINARFTVCKNIYCYT